MFYTEDEDIVPYDRALIARMKIGTVVELKHHLHQTARDHLPGHVVGFGVSSIGELLLEVKWAAGLQGVIHPNNVLIVE